MNQFKHEKLSANELILLSQLIERIIAECSLEDRTQSDIRLAISHCMQNRLKEQPFLNNNGN